ncbi:hypothetical protein ANN_03289 [Periplaneta americana]|uniref:Uncharacterized protein n=1 Tax=Periplaneta americana TaxID=6978 RepID=A0ABQ8U3X7_PERAM|nr:hypothetical protein ANN_03289 [Periplaneta americana]
METGRQKKKLYGAETMVAELLVASFTRLGEMSPGSNTESYPAFARIGWRENSGKNLNQVTCPDRDSNPGHLVSQTDALTVTPQFLARSRGFPVSGHLISVQRSEEEDQRRDRHSVSLLRIVMWALLGIPRLTVQRVYHRFRETGGYSRRPGSGRKRVTSARDDHFIVLNTLRDCHSTAVETRLQKIRRVKRTVRRRLDECALNSRRPAEGPELLQ